VCNRQPSAFAAQLRQPHRQPDPGPWERPSSMRSPNGSVALTVNRRVR
jgi:hypothetical protein